MNQVKIKATFTCDSSCCCSCSCTCYSMSKGDWRLMINMHIPNSESCDDTSSHVPLTAPLLSKSCLWFHLAPCVPKQYLQSRSKNIQGQPLMRWLKNELKIRRSAKSIIFLHVVDGFGRPISDLTHFNSTAWRGVNEHNWQCSELRCFTRPFQETDLSNQNTSFKGRHSSSKFSLETHEL